MPNDSAFLRLASVNSANLSEWCASVAENSRETIRAKGIGMMKGLEFNQPCRRRLSRRLGNQATFERFS